MRVAVIDTTIDDDFIGGAQTFLPKLLNGLVAKGHEVHLVAKREPNEKVRPRLERSGAHINTSIWNEHHLLSDEAPVFAGWLNKLAPDIFLISVSGDMGWAVLPLLESKIAAVSIAHSDADTFYDPLKYYAEFISAGIGVSEEICRQFVDYCGLPRNRVHWIPYGVEPIENMDTGQRHDAPTQIKLAYVGRLDEPQKRVSDLIRIVKRLRETDLDYHLTVIGDGPEMPKFKQELAREITEGTVKMAGWVTGKEVLRHLRRSEVSLLVSDSEGFCIALVEAMANGCTPVVTDIRSGNKQLVSDGENGFIVPVGDIDAFVEKITYLANNRPKLLEFRQKAWETGRQYSVERMVDAYERCFRQAIDDAYAHPRMPDPDFPLMPSCRSKYPLWLRRIKAKARSLVAG
jgi:glycosyltransferase involved in cell wall biosynthesis